jgi:CRISPR-associated endoribonuclease Cas6
MEKPLAPSGPARLYALILKVRPLQHGTLKSFNGELVHGAFLRWLSSAAPDVAAWLHEGQKRRLFTCSSLQFPRFAARQVEVERRDLHLPLEPEQAYTIRLTLLLSELFPLFHEALISLTSQNVSGAHPPFIQLGRQLLLLEEVQITNDDPLGWTGFTSLASLVEQASQARFGRESTLALEFHSLTAFSRGNSKSGYGWFTIMLPLPQAVFQNLWRRWEDIAPPELAGVIQPERIERYLQEDGAIIIDHNITAHHVHFTTHQLRGFLGTCTYQLRGPDEPASAEAPLTVRQQLYLLARLAFYTGIGYKTAMGLGQARLRP